MEGIEKKESIEKIKPKGIIAGGPGIGKSTFKENFSSDLKVKDLDSSDYRGDPAWPENYIADIIQNSEEFDLLLVATIPDVVFSLRERGLEVTVVCPDESLREEYERRLVERGQTEEKAKWLAGMGVRANEENRKNFAGGKLIILKSGQYLSDVVEMEN